MVIKMLYLYIAAIIIIFTASPIYGKVVINEFSPDRSPQAVELINTASESADLSGWYIDDNGGTSYYTIAPGTVLYPNACLVFEGDFNMNKSSADMVRLFDRTAPPTSSAAVLIDSYGYKQGPGIGQSYIRTPDGSGSWIAAPSGFGQWNGSDSNCILLPTPIPTIAPAETPSPEPPTAAPTPHPVPDRIFISEVYPYPAPGETEWIELYNDNDADATLENWYIDDAENSGGTPRSINLSLPAHGFVAIDISGALFNNDTDSVRLLAPDKKMADGFEYTKARKQMSFGRTSFDSDTVCLETQSKGTANNPCLEATPAPSPATIPPISPAKTPPPQPTIARITAQYYADTSQKPTVLGTMDQYEPVEMPVSRPIAPTSPIPVTYSILTIVSLLIKIKNGLTA